ncbi:HAD domain-containing protein [Streptomyces boluensis]|uniref:Secreted protein n=1 Tax=Streptomyces boluensis TaxID=1775135 RepID=A0A964UPB5_9ACTN|nr:HAD domain-containing protein [Streptomyces boluensis]NBE51508.1 hypothetical protein [Streptomyces boluensis]
MTRSEPQPHPLRPLLFLDVDGPLIPFGASPGERPEGYPTYRANVPDAVATAHPLLNRIDPRLGPRLAALGCELVWATTWMDDANVCVAPWLGLPQLPVVDWPEDDATVADDRCRGLHWKTRALVDRAAGRTFLWVDDEIGAADRAWVTAHHPGCALLHRVDPRQGLTETDLQLLERWLATLDARP